MRATEHYVTRHRCAACGFANPAEFRFCGGCGLALQESAGAVLVPHRPEPERRQLTVLFCDLAGSSMLASRLDPEELRDLILSYQNACAAVIRRYDGTISRYVGDGILVLFGYPRAHEDDPERAARAALEIVSSISVLSVPLSHDSRFLAVRIGIATGLVVVGDLIGEGASQEQAVVGETPNLAARLQALAAPNSVVIAAGTRTLLGERFDCADLGSHALHGFTDPVRAWRVVAPRAAASRFEAAQPARLLALVDREEYTRWLRRLWREVEESHGKVALLCGEAGIGKSRIVEALREKIAGTPYATLRYQCSPHYVNTALHPVIEHIERSAGIGRENTSETKLERLIAWIGSVPEAVEAVPLLAALLSIPCNDRFPLMPMSPQRQKERTFEILLGFMQRLAAAWPLPIVFEDVHWIDPTSQEFLTLLIDRVREMCALVVVTFRPEFSPPWLEQPHVTYMAVEGLAPEHALGLAQSVGAERLPREVIDHVVAKTDGVPLFIEELTRAVLDTRLGIDPQDPLGPISDATLRAIPSTLQDSLMARLDRLGPAKSIAQVASAIGREFSYALLEAVAEVPPRHLRDSLQLLEASGLVYREAGFDVESYAFKHALVQEAAYHTLLRSRRRELHTRIVETLESRFPQTARDAPELVAHHWTEAGEIERAVAGWLVAGQRASQRSEYREAIAHLRRGLDLVAQLHDHDARREYELALLLAVAPAVITTEGAGTPEAVDMYRRALALCDGRPDSEARFIAQWGWWRISMNHSAGRERADRLVELAQRLGDPGLLLQAHHCEWATLYMVGAPSDCCRHIEAGLALYQPDRDRVHAGRYGGHDARVCALGEGGLAHWMLGHADRALELAQSAVGWSDVLAHVGSRVHAMDYALVLRKFRRDAATVYRQAGELVDFASEQKLRVHRAKGAFFRGWARAVTEDITGGLKEMLEGIASERDSDTPHDFTLYYEMLAEVYGRAGRVDEALAAIDDAFAIAERHGIVFWNAELHRRRGELLLAVGQRGAAEAAYRQALTCGRAQGAISLELRAAVSLGRLHQQHGERDAARRVLRPVYAGFQEGFDTADLTEARKLLEVLT